MNTIRTHLAVTAMAVLLLFLAAGCKRSCIEPGPAQAETDFFTDPRDGQVYPVVTIDDKDWLAKNLNYPYGNSKCFGDKAENGLIYGRLYDFETACKVCPSGWHLPSDAEWQRLVDILGGEIWAGGKMKEAGLAHWASPNSGATNRSGFNAIGGGYRAQNDNFMGLTENGYFWSSLEFYTNNAWARDLYYGDEQIRRDYFEKTCMLSVRCIRN